MRGGARGAGLRGGAKGSRRSFLVDVQQRTEERDAFGQQKDVWTTVRREWASIDPISGREYFNASGERAVVTNRLRLPYVAAGPSGAPLVRPRDRILYQGTTYDIRAVIIKDLELELMCLEVV